MDSVWHRAKDRADAARRQNGARSGTHLGTSAATARSAKAEIAESKYCSRFPNAQAFGPNGSGLGLPGPVQLFGKANTGSETDENGAGLTNDPSGDNEITVGSFIQLDLFNILPSLTSLTMSFSANSTTSGETWQVWGTNTAGTLGSGTIPGGTLLDSCTSVGGPGDPCEAVRNIAGAGAFRYLDVTAFGDASNVLLHTVDAAVPGPIVGAGLPGLVATCGGLLGLARRRRRKQIA